MEMKEKLPVSAVEILKIGVLVKVSYYIYYS